MLYSAVYAFVLLFLIKIVNVSLATEPVCSKFAYEEQLLEKMIRTEIKVESIESEIKKTQDSVLNTLVEIKEKVADINDRFEYLRNNITEEMIAKTGDIEKKEEFFKNSFEELRRNFTMAMENQRKTLTDLQGNVSLTDEEIARPSVAFYAHHVTDTTQDVTDEIIVFDSTITNEGSGYDTSTGIFTAPVGGLYQFNIHVCARNRKYTFVGLAVAGNVVAAASNYDENFYSCNSVGAIVRVKSGEQVWVKCTSAASNRMLYDDKYRMNTFSGILLYK